MLGFGFMDVSNKEGVDYIIDNGPHYMIDGKKVGVAYFSGCGHLLLINPG